MNKTRIYRISDVHAKHPDRLVEASTRSQAVRHVADDVFNSRVATQDDLVELVGKGAKVEKASTEE